MTILLHKQFKRDFKELAKKYPSLVRDVDALVASLRLSPTQGTPLGNHCYKIRLKISAKRQGKSGGGRVITCVKIVEEEVWLLTLYDKSEMDNISDAFIDELVKNLIP